jgi:SAM-dependent methyltransferase
MAKRCPAVKRHRPANLFVTSQQEFLMHDTAFQGAKSFFDTYAMTYLQSGADTKVIEIGSQDLNGSLRECCPIDFEYIGVDFVAGKGVDLILEDPYSLPFETASADIIIASSCFEHSEMFWVLFLEVMRVLKPDGLFYLNVPSNGDVHRHPVDCWRFYPDSGRALVAWAKRNGMNPALLESYTSVQISDIWNDFVAVYVRDENHASRHPNWPQKKISLTASFSARRALSMLAGCPRTKESCYASK